MKKWLKEHWIIITIVTLFVIVRVLAIQKHGIVSWDAAVYVGMGKYLYSHGAVGMWEVLRPVALPIILGAFWKLGFNPYTVGTIFGLLTSVGAVIVAYLFGEEIRKGAGNIAASLLITASMFFAYAAIPVTDIASTFFSMLALYILYKAASNRQYFYAGLLVAVAFLFRFPHGLTLVVGGFAIIAKMFLSLPKKRGKNFWADFMVNTVEKIFSFAGGFFAIIVPDLVINYYAYGNAFLPFIEGNAVIAQYSSLYTENLFFYFIQLFKENPLYVLFLVPIGMLWKKAYRSTLVIILTIAILIIGGYFTQQAHKEFRYILAFLPYMAVLAGVGIAYVLDWFKMPQLLFYGLFAIVIFMTQAGQIVHAYHNPDAPSMYAFNSYFATAKDVPHDARVISSTPFPVAYGDVLIAHTVYGDWTNAYNSYTQFKDTSDYISLNSCGLEIGCADNAQCTAQKQQLLTLLAKEDTNVFETSTPSQCMLTIYKIKH
jgi:4-amino-4-deoxy-L-arabinose transferase-like glycosyltransferase